METADTSEPAAPATPPTPGEATTLLHLATVHHASARAAQPALKDHSPEPIDLTSDKLTTPPPVAEPLPAPLAATATAPALPLTPLVSTPDLAATLTDQIIDLSSNGQWIDGMAREIAALSAGEGRGSFRLAPEHLGPMRVDIEPGADGALVRLVVETEAAETALNQHRGHLHADARLAAVRIDDVQVERVAHVADAQRPDARAPGDSAQQQGQQNSQSAAQAQAQSHSGNGNSQPPRKIPPDPAVIHPDGARDTGGDGGRRP